MQVPGEGEDVTPMAFFREECCNAPDLAGGQRRLEIAEPVLGCRLYRSADQTAIHDAVCSLSNKYQWVVPAKRSKDRGRPERIEAVQPRRGDLATHTFRLSAWASSPSLPSSGRGAPLAARPDRHKSYVPYLLCQTSA